jgi:hypothetical protein
MRCQGCHAHVQLGTAFKCPVCGAAFCSECFRAHGRYLLSYRQMILAPRGSSRPDPDNGLKISRRPRLSTTVS